MKFNWNKARPRAETVNLAGGDAFRESPKLELAALLLTATLQDGFYRSGDRTAARVKELIAQNGDKRFVAKAALHARTEAGLRSVTHLAAGELAHAVKGETWTAPFFARLVRRPDDALEILAYTLAVHGRPVPNSLKKGLGAALARFDEYQLAKYRRADAEVSLVDAVNLVHPPHTEALRKLVNGTLAPAETWETRLTQAVSARTATPTPSPASRPTPGANSSPAASWVTSPCCGTCGTSSRTPRTSPDSRWRCSPTRGSSAVRW